jgi:uncharacterized protein (TIGR03000 family)
MRTIVWSVSLAVAAGVLLSAPVRAAEPRSRPATVVVRLPADARLTIDGHATRSTSAMRWFETPPLPEGKDYVYTFRAEFHRGDETVTVSKDVTVRAGRETVVSLGLPGTAPAFAGGTADYRYGAGPADAGSYYGDAAAAGPGVVVYSYPEYGTLSRRAPVSLRDQDPWQNEGYSPAGPPGSNDLWAMPTR